MKDTWTKPKGVGSRVGGEDGWGKGAVSSRNMYEGHMDKAKEGRIEGRRWRWLGRGELWRVGNGDNST